MIAGAVLSDVLLDSNTPYSINITIRYCNHNQRHDSNNRFIHDTRERKMPRDTLIVEDSRYQI